MFNAAVAINASASGECGDSSRYIPFSTARELAENIPGATLTQLTGRYHCMMEERPDEVTAALLELLARPCVASPAAGIRPR